MIILKVSKQHVLWDHQYIILPDILWNDYLPYSHQYKLSMSSILLFHALKLGREREREAPKIKVRSNGGPKFLDDQTNLGGVSKMQVKYDVFWVHTN